MPEGIFIIDFDEFEGGVVTLKYPDKKEFAVPDNIVQMLQISHNFVPGLMQVREGGFSALSYGNESIHKVIVLVLNKYEDSEDFKDIITQLNEIAEKNKDGHEELLDGVKRIFELSQSVFKAREAVMLKLAQEVAELKNKEADVKNALKFLMERERSTKGKILLYLMINGPSTFQDMCEFFKIIPARMKIVLQTMKKENLVEQQGEQYNLLIFYNDN